MPTSQNITANGQRITLLLGDGVSNAALHCAGTFNGLNCTFEASMDNGATWFATEAVRSTGNTIESVTGVLSAAPAYSWDVSCGGYTHVSVRSTAYVSGTQAWAMSAYAGGADCAPSVPSHAVTVSGTATVTPATPTQSFINSAATTNATSVKASAGTVYAITASNINAAARYLKIYNKASAPTVGTDVPVLVLPIPATGAASVELGVLGVRFGVGIALALTAGAADADVAAVAASEIKVSVTYI